MRRSRIILDKSRVQASISPPSPRPAQQVPVRRHRLPRKQPPLRQQQPPHRQPQYRMEPRQQALQPLRLPPLPLHPRFPREPRPASRSALLQARSSSSAPAGSLRAGDRNKTGTRPKTIHNTHQATVEWRLLSRGNIQATTGRRSRRIVLSLTLTRPGRRISSTLRRWTDKTEHRVPVDEHNVAWVARGRAHIDLALNFKMSESYIIPSFSGGSEGMHFHFSSSLRSCVMLSCCCSPNHHNSYICLLSLLSL